MTARERTGNWILPFSMFFGTFAWSFVFVSLPFYIHQMSTLDATSTLRWTGWILGVSSLVTMITAPFSARLFGERNPKRSFILTQMLQGGGFFLMAVARTLPELFFSRMLLGFTGAAAAVGAMIAPRIGEIVGDRRTIVWFLAASSVGLAALAVASNLWSFGILRFLQVLCIAPVFPLSVAAIAQRASGTAIGIVNSSRIAAGFLGPVIATTLLAWMPPGALYLVLAGMGLLVVPLLRGLSGPGSARKEAGA